METKNTKNGELYLSMKLVKTEDGHFFTKESLAEEGETIILSYRNLLDMVKLARAVAEAEGYSLNAENAGEMAFIFDKLIRHRARLGGHSRIWAFKTSSKKRHGGEE